MFDSFARGLSIYKQNLIFIFKHPFMLIPYVFTLGINMVGMYYLYDWLYAPEMEVEITLLLIYLISVLSTFTIGITSLFILEMVEQLETVGKINIFKAIKDMVVQDLWQALPLILLWSVLDFILVILTAVTKRKSRNGHSSHTFLSRIVDTFRETIKLGMMVSFASVAWENYGIGYSYRRGVSVYKSHLTEILTGVGVSKITGFLTILILPVFYIMISLDLPIVTIIIVVALLFSIIWSMGKLVEQLYTAELFLWVKHYEKAREKAEKDGLEMPGSIRDVAQPSFVDNVFDLV